MAQHDTVIDQLHDLLERDTQLQDLIEASLRQADERAHAQLDPQLVRALPWPVDIAGYERYLREFVRWIPQQSDDPAWRVSAPEHRYAKEVSDRLAHFFWIIDQQVHDDGSRIAESSSEFADWLTSFARQWGSFLDTPESFDPDILEGFIQNAPEYAVEDSLLPDGRPNHPSGWTTFNQFFARQLNPGLRPVAAPEDNRVIASPADCSFQHQFDIDDESNIPRTTIKHSHHYGNVAQLLEGSRHADDFAGGTFVHYMLPPSAYHRFHVPVSGHVDEAYVVQGKVFMQVDLADGVLQSRDAADTSFEFSQTRGVITLDTSGSPHGDVGVIAVVSVGMSHVASVAISAGQGTNLSKGDEFGYFQFGGSDIIVLFQRRISPTVDTDPDPRHVGSIIATC